MSGRRSLLKGHGTFNAASDVNRVRGRERYPQGAAFAILGPNADMGDGAPMSMARPGSMRPCRWGGVLLAIAAVSRVLPARADIYSALQDYKTTITSALSMKRWR